MGKNKINIRGKLSLIAAIFSVLTLNIYPQNVSVNNNDISTSNDNETNVIVLEGSEGETTKQDTKQGDKKSYENPETTNISNENIKFSTEELTSGTWILETYDIVKLNGLNITKWNLNENELKAVCTWKDMIDIVHTVEAGFKWQDPPKQMKPGEYMNLEAIYTNIDYSTTANINLGVKMFFERVGGDFKNPEANAIEVMKMNKDRKSYSNEVKKGFFYAPRTFFDGTNQCQLVVDCYIGKDHYVTTYTYNYQR